MAFDFEPGHLSFQIKGKAEEKVSENYSSHFIPKVIEAKYF
jgi:hypothetical protein